MAFTASLPTFNTVFSSWAWDVGLNGYVALHIDAPCQFYIARWKMPVQVWAQYRGQRDPELEENFGHIYPILLVPIDVDDMVLLDPFFFTHENFAIVKLNFANLGDKYYRVQQVEIRYDNFPNAHICVVLRPDKLEGGIPFPAEIDPDLSTIVVAPDQIVDDDIEEATITVTYLDPDAQPIPNRSLTITSTDGGTIVAPNGVTDAGGEYSTTYHSPVAETVTFSTADVGPSNELDVVESPPDMLAIVAGMGNGTCSTCSEADGDNPLFQDGPPGAGISWSNDLPFTCAPGGTLHWSASHVFATGFTGLNVTETTLGAVATYTATHMGWDLVTPVTLNRTFQSGVCDWPMTVDLAGP